MMYGNIDNKGGYLSLTFTNKNPSLPIEIRLKLKKQSQNY